MYEIDFSGWTRTPENIEAIKNNKKYRRWRNSQRLIKSIRYRRRLWDITIYFFDWLFNRESF